MTLQTMKDVGIPSGSGGGGASFFFFASVHRIDADRTSVFFEI